MKFLEIACYVLAPLAWGLAAEFVFRRLWRRGPAGGETGDEA